MWGTNYFCKILTFSKISLTFQNFVGKRRSVDPKTRPNMVWKILILQYCRRFSQWATRREQLRSLESRHEAAAACAVQRNLSTRKYHPKILCFDFAHVVSSKAGTFTETIAKIDLYNCKTPPRLDVKGGLWGSRFPCCVLLALSWNNK